MTSKLRAAAKAARDAAKGVGALEPEAVITGTPVAYIPRCVLRDLLDGKLSSAKVYPAPTPSDYALIAVPQERVEGIRQRLLLGELLTEGVIEVGDNLNTCA